MVYEYASPSFRITMEKNENFIAVPTLKVGFPVKIRENEIFSNKSVERQPSVLQVYIGLLCLNQHSTKPLVCNYRRFIVFLPSYSQP